METSQAQRKKEDREKRERERDAAMLQSRNEIRFNQRVKKSLFDETKIENPLVLYSKEGENLAVIVDERLSNELQLHQREGVQKMYNIVSKYVAPPNAKIKQGFILADKQGLGNEQNQNLFQ